jgi:hypothetical protein
MINDSESSDGESVLDKKQRKRKDRSVSDFTVELENDRSYLVNKSNVRIVKHVWTENHQRFLIKHPDTHFWLSLDNMKNDEMAKFFGEKIEEYCQRLENKENEK